MGAYMVFKQTGQHGGKAVNGIYWYTFRAGHGREGMKGAENKAAAIYQNQMGCFCHTNANRVSGREGKKKAIGFGYAPWVLMSSIGRPAFWRVMLPVTGKYPGLGRGMEGIFTGTIPAT
ncbi:hypothetical protein WSS15_18630 [Acetobacter pasteurianus]|nr:hypothetical protein WSS15_18630 [Acetobacter pasteurianus]